ncbi:MAG: ABC transporter substrate-binding protein [Bacteroidetes bacterium]|nr:ABC transporter substrate-binding protein [Bacteroidota bacterium]
MPTIGILLPRSSYYETMSFDMIEGLRSGLRANGLDDVRVVTENIGFGAEKQQCYRSAEKLLLEENATVVLAYVCQRTAQLLRPLFLAAKRLLIVLDSGANMPLEWPASPNILYHSLNNSAGAYLIAQMALKDGFRKGAMVTGYYDGGYLHTYALVNGFMQGGGEMAFNHVTGYTQQDFTMAPLPGYLSSHPDTCLLSLFSGDFCEWYFRGIREYFPENAPPVYLAPFSLEETMLARAVFPGSSVKGVATWSKQLDNAQNKAFCKAMEDAGREASLFSLLGWEGAALCVIALEAVKVHKNDVAAASEEIKAATFHTPRGLVQFHQATNQSFGPMYEVKLEEDEKGFCRLHITGEVNNVKEALDFLSISDLEQNMSGWYNSYACN